MPARRFAATLRFRWRCSGRTQQQPAALVGFLKKSTAWLNRINRHSLFCTDGTLSRTQPRKFSLLSAVRRAGTSFCRGKEGGGEGRRGEGTRTEKKGGKKGKGPTLQGGAQSFSLGTSAIHLICVDRHYRSGGGGGQSGQTDGQPGGFERQTSDLQRTAARLLQILAISK